MNIPQEIGLPAVLEQTAEEATELAKACLKLARVLRRENPTPVTIEEAKEQLYEEWADLEVCLDILSQVPRLCEFGYTHLIRKSQKKQRWEERIKDSEPWRNPPSDTEI